jgi:hypothetical protein
LRGCYTTSMKMSLLKPRAYSAKIALLAIFTLAYLPLLELKSQVPFTTYLWLLAGIHVYFFVVLFSGVAWRELRTQRFVFLMRWVSIVALVAVLMALSRSELRSHITLFLGLNFMVHVALVSVLHMSFQAKKKSSKLLAPVK